MNLLIPIEYDYDFVLAVREKFIRDIYLNLKPESFFKIDVEMNSLFDFPEVVISKEIISYALDKLIIVKRSRYYSIEFNSVINYPKTKIKLITLLRFISYGNSDVHGNSILIDEFKKLNINLYTLYKIYKLKGIVV